MHALQTAATGMAAQDLQVQVISNNIANMSTTGYKRQLAAFSDLLYEHVRRIGTQSSDQGNILPVGIDIGSGVKTVGTPRVMTQGTLSQTGNAFDVAITGDGFFKILMPDGTYSYTRDGSFQLDGTGRLVTSQGYVVQPGITVPQNATAFTVNTQGQVSVTAVGATTPTVLGQLTLTRFLNQAGLLSIGDNLLQETPASGQPQDGLPQTNGAGTIQQSNLEQSNVDSVTEISNLIAAQRAYEMNSKVITAADEMLSSVVHGEEIVDVTHAVASPCGLPPRLRLRSWGRPPLRSPGRCPAPPALPIGDGRAPTPTLKRSVTVTSDIVRIGDLIDNAGAFAPIPVFRSPDVGTTGSVPGRKVIEAARANNLFGVESGDVVEIEVHPRRTHYRPQGNRGADRATVRRHQWARRRLRPGRRLRSRGGEFYRGLGARRRAQGDAGRARSALRPLRCGVRSARSARPGAP